MNRSIPFSLRSPEQPTARYELRTFNHAAQQWGTYLGGFAWQFFCTGTYRHYRSLQQTEVSLRAFFERLGRALDGVPVAYAAVRERRTAGLGMPAIPAHWHFLFAVPEWHQRRCVELAGELWRSRNGKFDIRRYDPAGNAAFYVSKLAAGSAEFDIQLGNLERLAYNGPDDLFETVKNDCYVPEHVKHLTSGETLVRRPV